MRVAVSSTGNDLDAPISPVFARCPVYLFVDTETMESQALSNPATSASSGAGIQAAQFVAGRGVEAVLTGNVGPNAYHVLQAAGVAVYSADRGNAREAIAALKEGRLTQVSSATATAHAGMRQDARGGRYPGTGRTGFPQAVPTTGLPGPQEGTSSKTEEDLAALKEQVRTLREQLEDLIRRLEQQP